MDDDARMRERSARWQENEDLLTSQRPMTHEEDERDRSAIRAYYDGEPTVEDVLVRAETELRYACHVSACNCSGTALRANLGLLYVREALALIRRAPAAAEGILR